MFFSLTFGLSRPTRELLLQSEVGGGLEGKADAGNTL